MNRLTKLAWALGNSAIRQRLCEPSVAPTSKMYREPNLLGGQAVTRNTGAQRLGNDDVSGANGAEVKSLAWRTNRQ